LKIARFYNATRNVVLAEKVMVATNFMERLRGLIARKEPGQDQGMYIEPCSAIHTFFMSYPIDCAFLDKSGRILATRRHLAPWRLAGPVPGAKGVLEVAADKLEDTRTQIGDIITF